MEEQMARRLVAAEGKKLQQTGLVARTWGNISCRIDENHFVITPSGLDYETMTARDLVLMDIRNGVCCGAHKPSSEKGVHLAAYQTFPGRWGMSFTPIRPMPRRSGSAVCAAWP